jgi:hypothetical protein
MLQVAALHRWHTWPSCQGACSVVCWPMRLVNGSVKAKVSSRSSRGIRRPGEKSVMYLLTLSFLVSNSCIRHSMASEAERSRLPGALSDGARLWEYVQYVLYRKLKVTRCSRGAGSPIQAPEEMVSRLVRGRIGASVGHAPHLWDWTAVSQVT